MGNFLIDNVPFYRCAKVLPTAYDDSLSYYENICKLASKVNDVIDFINTLPDYILGLLVDDKLKEILGVLLNQLEEQIAGANEELSETASADRNVGDYVWLNGLLYIVIKQMTAGDKYVTDSNVKKITIEDGLRGIQVNIAEYVEVNSSVASKNLTAGMLVWFNGGLIQVSKDITVGSAYAKDVNYSEVTVESVISKLNEKVEGISSYIDKNLDWLNNFALPENYGAVGDGATDDSAAFKMAIATNKPLLLHKKYNITDITFNQACYFVSGSKLYGHGTNNLKEVIAPKEYILVEGAAYNITNDVCFSEWFGADNTGATDSTYAITKALNCGCNIVELQSGTYRANITIPNFVELRGQGIENTTILPNSNSPIINTSDRYNIVRDLTVKNDKYVEWPLVIGLNITKRLDRSVFSNVRFENVARGLYSSASMIWNEFHNCMFYGCLFYGIYISTSEAVNNNTFYNCEIATCTYSGVYIDSGDLSFDNAFIGCNVESTNVEFAGRPAHTEVDSNYFNTRVTFSECYFENLNGSSCFRNFNLLRLVNSFIGVISKPVLRISGTPKQTLLQACDGYNITGALYATDSQKNATLVNCVDIPTE